MPGGGPSACMAQNIGKMAASHLAPRTRPRLAGACFAMAAAARRASGRGRLLAHPGWELSTSRRPPSRNPLAPSPLPPKYLSLGTCAPVVAGGREARGRTRAGLCRPA
eukprot:355993-Chlamydomonas_euryale.AAC.20